MPIDSIPKRFRLGLVDNAFDVADPKDSQLTELQKELVWRSPIRPEAIQSAVTVQQIKRDALLRQFMELDRHMQAASEILDVEES